MVSITKAADIIDANYDLANFVGAVPFEEVWVAESDLGVRFPELLSRVLATLRRGIVRRKTCIRAWRARPTSLPNVVWATEALRTSDDFFPADLVVIQDTGEGDILCLATSRLNDDNECPVVQWIPEMSFEEQTFEVINSTFAHFLLRQVRSVI